MLRMKMKKWMVIRLKAKRKTKKKEKKQRRGNCIGMLASKQSHVSESLWDLLKMFIASSVMKRNSSKTSPK
jgi:hypothetical protein